MDHQHPPGHPAELRNRDPYRPMQTDRRDHQRDLQEYDMQERLALASGDGVLLPSGLVRLW